MNNNNNNQMNSCDKNWLAFSLSNTFSSSSSTHPPPHVQGDVLNGREEGNDSGASATDLSIYSYGPKLADFLGGGDVHTTTTTTTTEPATPPLLQHEICNFSSVTRSLNELYNSEFKTMETSFLQSFSTTNDTPQIDNQKPQPDVPEIAPKKTGETFGQRTSIYRGVTRHRWTGRYEAHLWDNTCRREGQSRKGRQVYLGGYDKEEKAAKAYDLAALKYWGPSTTTNFPIVEYEKELKEMKNMTRLEFVASLRRKSSGFSRGASMYRGVTRHHQHGRWQARIGRVAGNKDLYLGTFSTQEEAAEAYDIAAIKFRGVNAVTNFDISRYDVKSIASTKLPVEGVTTPRSKSKISPSSTYSLLDNREHPTSAPLPSISFNPLPNPVSTNNLGFAIPIKEDSFANYWTNVLGFPKSPNSRVSSTTPSFVSNLQSPSGLSMEFPFNTSNSNNSSNEVYNNVGGYVLEENSVNLGASNSALIIPLATPIIAIDGSSGSNWSIAPSLHTYQAAKPNLFVLQAPIFGLE